MKRIGWIKEWSQCSRDTVNKGIREGKLDCLIDKGTCTKIVYRSIFKTL